MPQSDRKPAFVHLKVTLLDTGTLQITFWMIIVRAHYALFVVASVFMNDRQVVNAHKCKGEDETCSVHKQMVRDV